MLNLTEQAASINTASKFSIHMLVFLEQSGFLNEFIDVVRLHDNVKQYRGISSSFTWSTTVHGNTFWREISEKFEDHMCNNYGGMNITNNNTCITIRQYIKLCQLKEANDASI